MSRRALGLLFLLLASACTTSSGDATETTPRPLRPLESPTAVPDGPRTTSPSPGGSPAPTPSPTPLPRPRGAEVRAASGVQQGRANPHCWTVFRGAPSECSPGDEGAPPPLTVRSGEVVALVIDAARPPDEASIRAFRGSRADYPSQKVEPTLRLDLTLDLPEGEWSLDLCAAWYGHGEPICWVFSFDVVPVPTPTPSPTSAPTP